MSTALVSLGACRCGDAAPADVVRARADFVAQLIATCEQAPQTRARRRARSDEAVAAYRTARLPAPRLGRALSRSA